jgi:hypothetical protein
VGLSGDLGGGEEGLLCQLLKLDLGYLCGPVRRRSRCVSVGSRLSSATSGRGPTSAGEREVLIRLRAMGGGLTCALVWACRGAQVWVVL